MKTLAEIEKLAAKAEPKPKSTSIRSLGNAYKVLRANGFSASGAVDWFIEQGAIDPSKRKSALSNLANYTKPSARP